MAVNPVTNKIYVGCQDGLTIIDGATNSAFSVEAGAGGVPVAVGVNPVTNKVYVANGGNILTVLDGATNIATNVVVDNVGWGMAVDTVNNRIYVTNFNGGSVSVVDGSDNSVTSLMMGNASPTSVGVNPVTNRIYVADVQKNNVTVIDGANNSTVNLTDPAAKSPRAVVVNPATNKTYVANAQSNSVSVIDGISNAITSVAVGANPVALDLNPITNKIYVADQGSNDVTVIDGSTNATNVIPLPNPPGAVIVNPVSNTIYVGDSVNVVAIDGLDNSITSLPTLAPCCVVLPGSGSVTVAMALNPVTNKLYVINEGLTVFDASSNSITTVPIAGAISVAVNPATNKIYVGTASVLDPPSSAGVIVLNGDSNDVTATIPENAAVLPIRVNPLTNRIYAMTSFDGVDIIDGATDKSIGGIPGNPGLDLAVNFATNKVYAALGGFTSVVDGLTNTVTGTLGEFLAVGVNPATGKIYSASALTLGDVSVTTEQQVAAIPLTTSITPLPGNATPNSKPTFSFTTSSSYSPVTPQVQNVYYQVDTWQGTWLAGTGSAPNFSGTLPTLAPGVHILYAFAEDAQAGDSIQPGEGDGGQSSPLIGAISAYVFLEAPPQPTTILLALSSGNNPALLGQPLTFTATLPVHGVTPTGSVQFMDGGTLLGSPVPLANRSAQITTSTLAAGLHAITAAYSGDSFFLPSSSPVLFLVVNNPSDTATVASLTLASSPSRPGQRPNTIGFRQSAILTATVTPSPGTNGTCVFKDGNVVLSSVAVNAGVATLDVTNMLRVGQHNLLAIYSGGGGYQGGLSSALIVLRSPLPH